MGSKRNNFYVTVTYGSSHMTVTWCRTMTHDVACQSTVSMNFSQGCLELTHSTEMYQIYVQSRCEPYSDAVMQCFEHGIKFLCDSYIWQQLHDSHMTVPWCHMMLHGRPCEQNYTSTPWCCDWSMVLWQEFQIVTWPFHTLCPGRNAWRADQPCLQCWILVCVCVHMYAKYSRLKGL